MPFIRQAIVVDPVRRAEGQSSIGAADKHHVRGAASGRLDTRQHVNVVVSRAARAVNRKEHLSTKAYSIYAALNDAATEVNSGVLVKGRRLPADLRVARANAVK